ncbi:MAG: PstS family phosphate ABC transporter substrate-binding protein [Promethearchaeota archaeon]
MKLSGTSIVVGLIIGLLIGVPVGWFVRPQAIVPPAVSLKTAGSTTVYPLSVAWAGHYSTYTAGVVKLEVSAGGSGYGRSSAVQGSVDFGAASSYKDPTAYGAASDDQIATIPVAADALAVVCNTAVNASGVAFMREWLVPIFQGNITTWEDLETEFSISVDATGSIQVYHRSEASGTTATFTGWLEEGEYATYNWTLGAEELINWSSGPRFHGAEGNPAVANGVAGDSNGIGYVGLTFTEGLAAATIWNEGNNEWVDPSAETAKTAIPASPSPPFSIMDSTAPGAYPIVRLIYYLVNKEPPATSFLRTQYGVVDPYGIRQDTINFLNWALSATGGQDPTIIRTEVGYLEITGSGAETYSQNLVASLSPFVQPVNPPTIQFILGLA